MVSFFLFQPSCAYRPLLKCLVLEYLLDQIGHWNSFFTDHTLCKVPFDKISQSSTLLGFQILKKRMSVWSIHINFFKHIKLDVVFGNKCFNIITCSRFLVSKLVAWKG